MGNQMPVSDWLKNVLVCPLDRDRKLIPGDAVLIDRLNEQVRAGRLKNRGGNLITETFLEVLVRDDGTIAYPVLRGIPVLVPEDGIDCQF